MQIFICGLYRSGTTITWKTLAQDKNLASFDEPFNENLLDLPQLSLPGDNACYLPRFYENPELFRAKVEPIYPPQDLKSEFTAKQKEYLQWLLAPYNAINVDFTRCTFKLDALRKMYPDALIIHLRRSPVAFTSSHVSVSYKAPGLKAAFGRFYRKKTFFTRKSHYDFYNYQKIIEQYSSADFAYLLPQLKNYKNKNLQELPAYINLLLLHKHNQNIVDKFVATHPYNFMEWQFENFAKHPEKHFQQIYRHFAIEMPNFDFSHLKPPNLGYLPDSDKWDIFL